MHKMLIALFISLLINLTAAAQEDPPPVTPKDPEIWLEQYERLSEYAGRKYVSDIDDKYDVTATDNPNFDEFNGFYIELAQDKPPVRWLPYKTQCQPCNTMVDKYNETMQELFNARAMVAELEAFDQLIKVQKNYPAITKEDIAKRIAFVLDYGDLISEKLPELKRLVEKLSLSTKYLRRQITECEMQCIPESEQKNLVSLPYTEIIQEPEPPFEWQGPYGEVCEPCRKLANQLNELRGAGIENTNDINRYETKISSISSQLSLIEIFLGTSGDQDYKRSERQLKRDLKEAENALKKSLKEKKKLIDNFNKTLKKYQDCIKKCPPQKNANPFPDELFESEYNMELGPTVGEIKVTGPSWLEGEWNTIDGELVGMRVTFSPGTTGIDGVVTTETSKSKNAGYPKGSKPFQDYVIYSETKAEGKCLYLTHTTLTEWSIFANDNQDEIKVFCLGRSNMKRVN